MMRALLFVGLGSGLGGMLRYAVSCAIRQPALRFPWATLAVNLAGCLLIGLFCGIAARQAGFIRQNLLLFTTGFCGGFTTFSAFANESLLLLQSQRYGLFALYVLTSFAGGLAAVWLGYQIIKN